MKKRIGKNTSKKIRICIIYAMVGLVVGYIFYKHIIGAILCSILFTVSSVFTKISKDQNQLHEFRMFLNGIYTELTTGSVMTLAIMNSREALIVMDPTLKQSIEVLMRELGLGQSEKLAWLHFSQALDIKPARQFTKALQVAYDQGSDLRIVVSESITIITDQMDLEMSISVILASKKFEFYVLMVMPILMLMFLGWTDQSYMSVLYVGLAGRIVMSFVLLALIIAYKIGEQIIKIEV